MRDRLDQQGRHRRQQHEEPGQASLSGELSKKAQITPSQPRCKPVVGEGTTINRRDKRAMTADKRRPSGKTDDQQRRPWAIGGGGEAGADSARYLRRPRTRSRPRRSWIAFIVSDQSLELTIIAAANQIRRPAGVHACQHSNDVGDATHEASMSRPLCTRGVTASRPGMATGTMRLVLWTPGGISALCEAPSRDAGSRVVKSQMLCRHNARYILASPRVGSIVRPRAAV